MGSVNIQMVSKADYNGFKYQQFNNKHGYRIVLHNFQDLSCNKFCSYLFKTVTKI